MTGTDEHRDGRDKATRCPTVNRDGSACAGSVYADATFCRWHDPALAQQRRESSQKGGRAKANTVRAKKKYANSVLDPVELQGVVGATIRDVLNGDIPPNVATAVAALVRTAVAVHEAVDVELRLVAIETALTPNRRVSA